MSALDTIFGLQQPLADGGIRSVNFFNGRLLASKDLSREQDARREADARLGQAAGAGVAFGLDIRRDPGASTPGVPVLRMAPGLALNALGQTLRVVADTRVALTRGFDPSVNLACGDGFASCAPPASDVYIAGAGVYLLTIMPAVLAEGRAPTNGLDPGSLRCNTDAHVEAIQFRLIPIPLVLLAGLDPAANHFRNALAYRGFGQGVHADWVASLLEQGTRHDDLLSQLDTIAPTPREVPLALIYMTGAADIVFIDEWAVRRPLNLAGMHAPAGLAQGRRLAVGQAIFHQFQEHIAQLASPGNGLGNITARSHFRYLPAVGLIPLTGEGDGADVQATRFFSGTTYRGPAFINGAQLENLVRESLHYPPIDLQGREFIWLYRVRENRQAIEQTAAAPVPRSYLVFASGQLPYRADARFDAAYWDYSNYALAR